MRLKFTKEQTEKIIKSYYKMYYGKDSRVETKISKGNVETIVTSEIEVLGESVKAEIELNQIEVTNTIKAVLSEQGYEVEDIYYDIEYINDDYFNDSIFYGTDVEVKQPIKQKTI